MPFMVLVMWDTGSPVATPVAVGGTEPVRVGTAVTCKQRGNPIEGVPVPSWAR